MNFNNILVVSSLLVLVCKKCAQVFRLTVTYVRTASSSRHRRCDKFNVHGHTPRVLSSQSLKVTCAQTLWMNVLSYVFKMKEPYLYVHK